MQAIVSHARSTYGRKYTVALELDAGVGVADMVLAKRAPHSTRSLKALGSVSPRLAILLSHEVGRSITSRHALAANLGTSEDSAQRIIARLCAAGVAKNYRNNLDICTIRKQPFESIIAIEAKIRDWQRVLVQAYRNLQFADASWVVLDHASIRPALTHIERFELTGVGLASMRRGGELVVHREAVRKGPISPGRRWQAQSVLATQALARGARGQAS